jgi:hypothetical protein
MNYVLGILLLVVGIYDAYLAITKKPTFSKLWQKLFPAWLDIIFFVLGIYVICQFHSWFPSIDFTIWAIMLAFWGHITFANKETYDDGVSSAILWNWIKKQIGRLWVWLKDIL